MQDEEEIEERKNKEKILTSQQLDCASEKDLTGDSCLIPGWEDPLEKEVTTHSSILAWEILWTEEPGGLQSMGSQESTWHRD